MTAPPSPPPAARPSAALRAVAAALLAVGLASRALPLLLGGGRLVRQFPTEDGYLMLTIARNLAAGLGMSTAAGTIPTNGTQPLMSFVYALGFRLVGGDRESGVAFALGARLLFAVLGAWLVLRFARLVFASHPRGETLTWLTAAIWFASGISVKHSMNCLESGLFAGAVVLFTHQFLSPTDPLAPWSVRRSLQLGGLLGLALWARIDAVFLVAAACLARAALGPGCRFRVTGAQFASAVWMGATAVLAISPWLIHNQLNFGSIMPVSGRAEASFGGFASNLAHLPVAIAEYAVAVVPVPARFEDSATVTALSIAAIAFAVFASVQTFRRADVRVRTLIVFVALYAAGMWTYYGLFFSVPFFLSRYMFPFAVFGALLFVTVVDHVLANPPLRWMRGPAVVGAAALLVAANVRIYLHGHEHMHFQVVDWIRANVREDEWVAAVQTGTIGFFHDRAINLDGKVNPAAFEATREKRIPEYVVGLPVRYLADWASLSEWTTLPVIDEHFELIVNDPQLDLAVFRRREGR